MNPVMDGTDMPEQTTLTPVEHALFGPLSRIGERVARLEAGHEALKGDTESIRSNLHTLANEVQKVVITEERCLSQLSTVAGQVSELVRAMPGVTATISAFEGMRTDLRTVIEANHQARGAESVKERLLNHLGRILPWLAAVGAIIAWGYEHVRVLWQ